MNKICELELGTLATGFLPFSSVVKNPVVLKRFHRGSLWDRLLRFPLVIIFCALD